MRNHLTRCLHNHNIILILYLDFWITEVDAKRTARKKKERRGTAMTYIVTRVTGADTNNQIRYSVAGIDNHSCAEGKSGPQRRFTISFAVTRGTRRIRGRIIR